MMPYGVFLVLLASAIGATYLAAIRQQTVAVSSVFGILLWGMIALYGAEVTVILEDGSTTTWGNNALMLLAVGMLLMNLGLLFLGATDQMPGEGPSRSIEDYDSKHVNEDNIGRF